MDEEEKNDVKTECKKLNIGLLIVNQDSCQEVVEVYLNQDLKEENRIVAKNTIVQYFPDFGSEENLEFFKRYAKLADTILQESYRLIEDCLLPIFRKITPRKKLSIKQWHGNRPFELYLDSKLDNSKVFLTMKSFGSEIFEVKSPILLIEQRFKSSIIKKPGVQQKLSTYIEECLRKNCIVETADYYHYDTKEVLVTSKKVLDNIKDNISEDFSIHEQIEIQGIEKKLIKSKVKKILLEIVNFSNSLNLDKSGKTLNNFDIKTN